MPTMPPHKLSFIPLIALLFAGIACALMPAVAPTPSGAVPSVVPTVVPPPTVNPGQPPGPTPAPVIISASEEEQHLIDLYHRVNVSVVSIIVEEGTQGGQAQGSALYLIIKGMWSLISM